MNIWPRRASTHISELTPFCLHLSLAPSTKFPAESCVAECLKVLSMQLLSHRGTDWPYPRNPKKHQFLFFSEKIYYRTTVSRRHFLPLKATASLHNAFCFHFLLIDVCLMRKWGEKTKNLILWIVIASLLFSNPIVYDEQKQHFALFLLWVTQSWRQKDKVEAYL